MTHSRITLRPPLLFIVLLAFTFSGADLWEARAEKQKAVLRRGHSLHRWRAGLRLLSDPSHCG